MPRRTKTALKQTGKQSVIIECPHCHQKVIPSRTCVCPSCLNLTSAIPQVPDIQPSTSPFKLWTPRQIAVLTFFMGYPSGLVLSSINWIRMGETGTAVVHLTAGFILLSVWGFILDSAPTSCGGWLGLVMNIGLCLYLYQQMKQSIGRFTLEGHEVDNATWRSGCLTGLAAFFVFVLLLGLIYLFLSSGH